MISTPPTDMREPAPFRDDRIRQIERRLERLLGCDETGEHRGKRRRAMQTAARARAQ